MFEGIKYFNSVKVFLSFIFQFISVEIRQIYMKVDVDGKQTWNLRKHPGQEEGQRSAIS